MFINIPFANRTFGIELCPTFLRNGVAVYKSRCRKYIDDVFSKTICFHFLWISYTHFNYNRIVHVILDSRNTFRRTETSDQLIALSNQLKEEVIAAEGDSSKNKKFRSFKKLPVSFGVELADVNDDKTKEYRFYITAKRKWLEKNGYGALLPKPYFNDYCKDIEDNADKFPKYRRFVREVIFV